MEFITKFFALFTQNMPRLLEGIGMTLKMTLISLIFATVIGIVLGLFSVSKNKILNKIESMYVYIIRGVPLIVLAFFIYFGVSQTLNIKIDAFVAGVITLTLNASAYLAEIFRGGIQSVDKGQMEAARSLGMPYSSSMIKVVLPQAVRIVTPSLINQLVITLKDTSILSVIGVRELVVTSKIIIAANYESMVMWTIVAILYFIPITVLSLLSKYIERRMMNGQSKG